MRCFTYQWPLHTQILRFSGSCKWLLAGCISHPAQRGLLPASFLLQSQPPPCCSKTDLCGLSVESWPDESLELLQLQTALIARGANALGWVWVRGLGSTATRMDVPQLLPGVHGVEVGVEVAAQVEFPWICITCMLVAVDTLASQECCACTCCLASVQVSLHSALSYQEPQACLYCILCILCILVHGTWPLPCKGRNRAIQTSSLCAVRACGKSHAHC